MALTSKPRKFSGTFGAMKIRIEIEIKIASFRQDCRKDQDCLLLGNLLKELIGTVSGDNLHHWYYYYCYCFFCPPTRYRTWVGPTNRISSITCCRYVVQFHNRTSTMLYRIHQIGSTTTTICVANTCTYQCLHGWQSRLTCLHRQE